MTDTLHNLFGYTVIEAVCGGRQQADEMQMPAKAVCAPYLRGRVRLIRLSEFPYKKLTAKLVQR